MNDLELNAKRLARLLQLARLNAIQLRNELQTKTDSYPLWKLSFLYDDNGAKVGINHPIVSQFPHKMGPCSFKAKSMKMPRVMVKEWRAFEAKWRGLNLDVIHLRLTNE